MHLKYYQRRYQDADRLRLHCVTGVRCHSAPAADALAWLGGRALSERQETRAFGETVG